MSSGSFPGAMAHLPRSVLAKNFGVAQEAFKDLSKEELSTFQTAVPGSLENDQKVAAGALPRSSRDFAFRTMEMPPTKRTKGGEARIVDSTKFKVTTTSMAMDTGPSTCGSIVAARLHPHHHQGYIVALRLPVRERGDLVQDRIDDLLRSLDRPDLLVQEK